MKSERVLGVDVGTSYLKAAVLDRETGNPVGTIQHIHCPLDFPTPDTAELPLPRFWTALVGAVKAAIAESGTRDLVGFGISCMMPVLVLLDAQERPLGPAWTHLDRRGREVAKRVLTEVGKEFHASTGNLPLPGGMSAITYAQIARSRPEIGANIARYLHLNGWIAGQLCGQYAFDPANAAFTGLYDLFPNAGWSKRWCEYFNVRPEWLPRVQPGEAELGGLTASRAGELGLPAGLPIKLGSADTTSAWLACEGRQGELLHVAGTTQVLAVQVERPTPGPKRLVRPLGVGNGFFHLVHNPVGGASLEWMRQLCFSDVKPESFYSVEVDAALIRKTSVRLDPPFLGGDRLEIEPRGAALGPLTLAADRSDLLAAVLVAMREGHGTALTQLGVPLDFSRIRLTGGAAKTVMKVIPDYGPDKVTLFDEGSLRGVAALFR